MKALGTEYCLRREDIGLEHVAIFGNAESRLLTGPKPSNDEYLSGPQMKRLFLQSTFTKATFGSGQEVSRTCLGRRWTLSTDYAWKILKLLITVLEMCGHDKARKWEQKSGKKGDKFSEAISRSAY